MNYKIIHADPRYGFMLKIIYTTVFLVKRFNNLTLRRGMNMTYSQL